MLFPAHHSLSSQCKAQSQTRTCLSTGTASNSPTVSVAKALTFVDKAGTETLQQELKTLLGLI